MAYETSIEDLILLKSGFKNIISNTLLIVEAKPVKSRKTEDLGDGPLFFYREGGYHFCDL